MSMLLKKLTSPFPIKQYRNRSQVILSIRPVIKETQKGEHKKGTGCFSKKRCLYPLLHDRKEQKHHLKNT